MQVVIKILLYRVPYTVCCISDDCLVIPDKQYYKLIGLKAGDCHDIPDIDENACRRGALKCTTNSLFLQPFVKCLMSDIYRTSVILHLNKVCGWPESRTVVLRLFLEPPDHEIIDYAWNDRMLKLAWTRVEIENAFSWLSTLGGAYSALGDYFEHCAEEAGRISIRQYKLSKLLGDEALAARSRLYLAIALAQKGRLHTARHIVRTTNQFAILTLDKRLHRMCLGVWAKLKYMKSLKIMAQGKGDGNGNVIDTN